MFQFALTESEKDSDRPTAKMMNIGRMTEPKKRGGVPVRRDQCVTTTSVPLLTRPNRSVMSSLYMRIQPWDTKPPIDPGLLVPWMAYSVPASVIAATPIGFCGDPPGTTGGKLV